MTLANYLYSLVYSDTYDVDRWQNWAEKDYRLFYTAAYCCNGTEKKIRSSYARGF